MSEQFIIIEYHSSDSIKLAEECTKLSKQGFTVKSTWPRFEVMRNPNCPDEMRIDTWVTVLLSRPQPGAKDSTTSPQHD